MKKIMLVLSVLLNTVICFSQTNVDSQYLEDQIYLTLSYDNLIDTPKKFEHNGFSGSFSFGFIKDIPLNEKRNVGFGIGLGYGYTAFIQNLHFQNDLGGVSLEEIDSYKTNWLKEHKLEMPLEIRFRGSTATKYKFWRVYTGVKISYVIASKSKFQNNEVENVVSNIKLIEKFKYGAILSAGFSTWNLYLYYGLKPMFKEVVLDDVKFNAKEFKIGLNFYIM